MPSDAQSVPVRSDGASPAEPPAAAHPPGSAASAAAAPAKLVAPRSRKWIWLAVLVCVVVAVLAGTPWIVRSLNTVSTDDAYVNGHVTFVAPRVPGQVARVLVDDNNRVRKGDLLVELDREPYEVQVQIAQSALDSAQSDLVAARAQVRATEALARSLRFNLEHAIEDVDNRVAVLKARFAALESRKATQAKAQSDYDRIAALVKSGAATKQQLDTTTESLSVARAQVNEALEDIHQVRASLGLPPAPDDGDALIKVPDDLDQTFSSVREAQSKLIQAAAQLGVTDSFNKSPKQMVADFYKRDPAGDIDRIYAKLLEEAPPVKQAEAKIVQAERNLEQAKLNLRYCNVVAEIDGAVTRRNVNPGNNVVAGQTLMAVRSLSEVWVDANFKETQIAELRIGQLVDLDVDMYGRHQEFKGRVSGFTMGTGSTLALLPPQNATGNFVKVVQRLPVRIDVLDYDPEKAPLFIGLSVTPHVKIKGTPVGPNAGEFLQAYNEMIPASATPEPTP